MGRVHQTLRQFCKMKTSASVICGCGQTIIVEAVGTRVAEEDLCPNCHAVLWFVEPLGNFAGQLIISRSWTELKNGDWTLTIVLGAMAVECEMARLYMKWNEIDLLTLGLQTMQTGRDGKSAGGSSSQSAPNWTRFQSY